MKKQKYKSLLLSPISISQFRLLICLICIVLILSCTISKRRRVSFEQKRKEMKELVLKAKEGDKGALSKIEKITELETNKSLETREEKQVLLWAIRKNPDSIFVPILLRAYERETDKALMRYLLNCISPHYKYGREVFFDLFKKRLENSSDSLELDLISSRLIGRLIYDDEIERFFPLLDRLSNNKAKENLMKYLALKKGGGFYKDAFQPYQVLFGSFPPCKLERTSYCSPELAEIVVLNDSLNDGERKILLDALAKKEGIYWSLLGLLREEDDEINKILLDWVNNAPTEFNRYKPLVSMKLKGPKASLNLLEEVVSEYPDDCKRCLHIISNIVDSNYVEDEIPDGIKKFAQWIVTKALTDTLKLKNLKGKFEKLSVPDLGAVRRSDTAYIFFRNVSIEPFEIPGKNVIFAKDADCYNNLRKSTKKNWGLSITLKWRGDWVIITMGTNGPPGTVLAGGFQEFLIRNVNGEWRLSKRLMGLIQ